MEVIHFNRVSLCQRTQDEFSYDIKQTILSIISGKYRHPAKKLVIDNIDLVVNSGEKIGIIGANGAGKSTLLNILNSNLTPAYGEVLINGINIHSNKKKIE